MEINELKANIRSQSGKGTARQLRSAGFMPAVFYGPKSESIRLSVNSSELKKILKGKEETVFIKLLIGNGQDVEKLSMIKELQIEPLSGKFLHADFYEISMDQKVTFDVAIHFTGVPTGVEIGGGELHHLKRELKISCLPTVLPDFIEVDVKNLDIGESLKVQDIKLMDGITVIDAEDTAIATVSTTRVTGGTVEAATGSATAEGAAPKE